jgi:hypothetical protein
MSIGLIYVVSSHFQLHLIGYQFHLRYSFPLSSPSLPSTLICAPCFVRLQSCSLLCLSSIQKLLGFPFCQPILSECFMGFTVLLHSIIKFVVPLYTLSTQPLGLLLFFHILSYMIPPLVYHLLSRNIRLKFPTFLPLLPFCYR